MPSHKYPLDARQYLEKGCGRCAFYETPACKVHTWTQVLSELRDLVMAFPFTEEIKWGVPVYTVNGKNIVSISALKSYAALSFFTGYLLKDEANILDKAGANSRIGRLIRFTSVEEVRQRTPILRKYLEEALDLQKTKHKPPPPVEIVFPEVFTRYLEQHDQLNVAFHSLTQGRKRGYSLYFASAKKTETLIARIEKCIPLIMDGKGLHDR